mmetsp:Transcript_26992/g.65132  ORF Transcript_26992/g.65132 Transcript_26992/m.65132 type:complete len:114 (+) Transcript_26992:798-1139(+)
MPSPNVLLKDAFGPPSFGCAQIEVGDEMPAECWETLLRHRARLGHKHADAGTYIPRLRRSQQARQSGLECPSSGGIGVAPSALVVIQLVTWNGLLSASVISMECFSPSWDASI